MAFGFAQQRNYQLRNSSSSRREELHFSFFEFGWPFAFMISAALCGLKLYFAWLFVIVILINRFFNNKYDFLIMLTILGCGMSLTDLLDTSFPDSAIIVFICIIILLLFRKKKGGMLRKLSWWLVGYFVAIVWLAHYSPESLPRQLTGILRYMFVVTFIIPVAVFSGKEFDTHYFFKRIMVFTFLFAAFFIFDVCVMNGCFLLPRDQSWIYYGMASDIENINIHPLSFDFPRRWPAGLYMYILAIYPLAKYYKLSIGKWFFLILAVGLSRTFTFAVGLIATYIFFSGNLKSILKYIIYGLIAMTALYFVDASLPEEEGNSTLRVKSSIDQILFFDLSKADDEDLAELGSSRGAQIIPKMEHLLSMGKQWVGFGFVRQDSNIQSLVIENEMYTNPDMAEEVATGVESMPFQVILTIGFIGLAIMLIFYIGISRIIKMCPLRGYYDAVLTCLFIIGISGFGGWIVPDTLSLLGLSLGVAILSGRSLTNDFAPLKPYTPKGTI